MNEGAPGRPSDVYSRYGVQEYWIADWRAITIEIFRQDQDELRLAQTLKTGDELYITHTAHREAFQRREAFLSAVAAAGMWAEPIQVAARANGEPMLEVWKVHRP